MTRSALLLLPAVRKALESLPGAAERQKTILVDLTPRLSPRPQGLVPENICLWLRALCDFQVHWNWILLTNPENHEEFAALEDFRVRRCCVSPRYSRFSLASLLSLHRRHRLRHAWEKIGRFLGWDRQLAWRDLKPVLRQHKADLLLCPGGLTSFPDAKLPMVAICPDISAVQRARPRGANDEQKAAHLLARSFCGANRVVCFSPQVRGEILSTAVANPEKVVTLPSLPWTHPPLPNAAAVDALLHRLELQPGMYFFYDAEATPVSNHHLLLTAFGMFRQRLKEPNWKLALAASQSPARADLVDAVERMGLSRQVVLLDEGTPLNRAALLQACGAALWPGLEPAYAGPLVHALLFDKPIMCGDYDALPETVRAAAMVIEPKKPLSLAEAMARVATDESLVQALVQRSQRQAKKLGKSRDAAQRLIEVLQDVLNAPAPKHNAVHGIAPDGWTAQRVSIEFTPAPRARTLRLKLQTPPWLPVRWQRIHVLKNRHGDGKTYTLLRGRPLTLKLPLPASGGSLELYIEPPVIPRALDISVKDNRRLGCICRECTILSATTRENLFACATSFADAPKREKLRGEPKPCP